MTAPNPAAGKPVDPASLVNVPRLATAYFVNKPDPADPQRRVSFGTSGIGVPRSRTPDRFTRLMREQLVWGGVAARKTYLASIVDAVIV